MSVWCLDAWKIIVLPRVRDTINLVGRDSSMSRCLSGKESDSGNSTGEHHFCNLTGNLIQDEYEGLTITTLPYIPCFTTSATQRTIDSHPRIRGAHVSATALLQEYAR
jgi:hypothetical protein